MKIEGVRVRITIGCQGRFDGGEKARLESCLSRVLEVTSCQMFDSTGQIEGHLRVGHDANSKLGGLTAKEVALRLGVSETVNGFEHLQGPVHHEITNLNLPEGGHAFGGIEAKLRSSIMRELSYVRIDIVPQCEVVQLRQAG